VADAPAEALCVSDSLTDRVVLLNCVPSVPAADMPGAVREPATVGGADRPADPEIRVVVVKADVLGWQPDANHIAEVVVESADSTADRFRCHSASRLRWLCGARKFLAGLSACRSGPLLSDATMARVVYLSAQDI
jgi:hypothetical protein